MLWLKLLGLVSLITALFVFPNYTRYVLSQPLKRPLAELTAPNISDRILVFSPHPDDESIALGGYIYSASQNGATVRIILVTDGNKQGLKEKRCSEFCKAAALLGISTEQLVFWDYPDGQARSFTDELTLQAEQEIDSFGPTLILYPHPADRHRDHSIIGGIVERQLSNNQKHGSHILAYRYLVHYWFFPQPRILVRNDIVVPPHGLIGLRHDWKQFFLDTEARDAKEAAINQYRSQLKNPFLIPLLRGLLRSNELLDKWSPGPDNLLI